MSRFPGQYGRGRPSSNTSSFNRPHYTDFGSQNEVNSYSETPMGGNSYDQNLYDGESKDVQYGYENEYAYGSEYGYEQQHATEVEYNYYENYQESSYTNQNDSYTEQTVSDYYSEPVSDYHNYSSGSSNFRNKVSGPSGGFYGRGKGRGKFYQNNKSQWQSQRTFSEGGQFGKLSGSERGQFEISEDAYQFSSQENSDVTSSPAKKTDEDDNKGQFGLPKESARQETVAEYSVENSDSEKMTVKEETTNEKAEEKKDEGNEEEKEEEEEDSSDEDTSFCKYCKLNFSTPKAYHTHTRGLQHTTLVMEAKAKKGNVHFQKEQVDASVLKVNIPAPKPPEPEVPVEDDFEENWMNLDDDVIRYLKERKNPANRDLNPNEVGKNPLPDDFNCPLCNVKCTGAGAFKMHIDGKQHRSNIEAAKQGAKIKRKKQVPSGVMVETKDRPSKLSEMIKSQTAPMLGLEFVTEFQKTDAKAAPRYVCNLCEAKCDGSTILPHVIGLKHRLKYMQVKKPVMYDHLTKFNSKKKKSEMNANLEEFAKDIEKEIGRGDIKVKVELEDFEDEDELKESMKRHSKELVEKVRELEEGRGGSLDDEPGTFDPPVKKPRMMPGHATDWRSRSDNDGPLRDRRDHHDSPGPERPRRPPFADYTRPPYSDSRKPPYVDPRRPPYDDPRRPQYNDPRRPPYDDPRRPPCDDPRRPPYDDPRRPPYNDPRRPPYDDSRKPSNDLRDPYGRWRNAEDFRASYRDRFDPYRSDDPMYERRMFDERRRLDGLMGERHQLEDPYLEQRRIDDIIARRRYLDELERARLEDIMERRKRLQETDVDYLRLKRFMDKAPQAASSSPSLSTDERKRLDDLLARREALAKTTESNTSNQTDIQAIQSKLASHRSTDPTMAAKQDQAVKDLQEEAAKNPNVNIGEIMASLSTSMIATEDDAAMALQISNALTQALLKYRLQNAPKELSTLTQTVGSVLEQKPAEQSIPGFGSSTSSGSVPAFLRTSQQSSYSSDNSISNNNMYSYTPQQTTETFQPVQTNVTSSLYPSLTSATSYVHDSQQVMSSVASALSSGNLSVLFASQQSSQPQYSYSQNVQSAGTTLYSTTSNIQQMATAPAPVPAPAQVTTAAQDQNKTLINTTNIDQPQKLLLESIRKQTELLRQKIQGTSGAAISGASNSPVNVQSQSKHIPGSSLAATSVATYTASTSSAFNPASTAASSYSMSSNGTPASSYSSQYYQYNYHTTPPNLAPVTVPPAPVPQVQPPLPSEPAPAPPLPTNDLPPLRHMKRR